ncbi:MAG: tripartite tricarboxylate transporter substrate binding protein [Burkholderiales bacterium]|nr:tripartite tricarboxylate transporter substrate binding protein [Burkholderiales bacterium]
MLCAAWVAGVFDAAAQPSAYPSRSVRIVVATAAGSGADIAARILASSLSASLGAQFVVENRPGAAGNIAAEATARAAPDGYTLLLMVAGMTINPALYSKLNYNIEKDFDPVALVASAPLVLAIHPSLPARDLKELIAFAKARPGELNYGSSGSGSSPHLAAEMLRMQAGINIVHVPYKGSPQAVNDLIAGQVAMMLAAPSSLMPHIESKRLRGLAVASLKPSDTTPGLATMSEAGLPGYEASTWSGVLAPAGTPKDIVARLNQEINNALRLPLAKKQLAAQRFDPIPSTQAEFQAYLRSELAKWGKLVRAAGAKVD